jgi:phosphomannomutase
MRGQLGIGPNRMKIYTVRKAVAGLALYLLDSFPAHLIQVAIAYDTRHGSQEFAEQAARVLARYGMTCRLFQEPAPTPLLSFACRLWQCKAGIMITASHNPAEYNGLKMYNKEGAQVISPDDTLIFQKLQSFHSLLDLPSISPLDTPLIIREAIPLQDYLLSLQTLIHLKSVSSLKILYSNLHGTGLRCVPEALSFFGFSKVSLVPEQAPPDPNFTMAPSPNPENFEALKLGAAKMIKDRFDLFLSTDPDADRVGLVVPSADDTPQHFSGNQIACLALAYLCEVNQEKPFFPSRGFCIKTIVTTELFFAIASKAHLQCLNVLTGFKYIADLIHTRVDQFVLGVEESCGLLLCPSVRDKDGIQACILLSQMATWAKRVKRISLINWLNELYTTHGTHREGQLTLTFATSRQGELERITLMDQLRTTPPSSIGGHPIVKTLDYLDQCQNQDLPLSDVLQWSLKGGHKVIVRPSGTEAKVKVYIEVVLPNGSIQETDRLKTDLLHDIEHYIIRCTQMNSKVGF